MIENKSGDKYMASCIKCGTELSIMLVAHRDKKKRVVGFIFSCKGCFPLIVGKARIVLKELK